MLDNLIYRNVRQLTPKSPLGSVYKICNCTILIVHVFLIFVESSLTERPFYRYNYVRNLTNCNKVKLRGIFRKPATGTESCPIVASKMSLCYYGKAHVNRQCNKATDRRTAFW